MSTIIIRCQAVDRSNYLIYTNAPNMKKTLHPDNYRLVVFKDLNNNTTYITRSTAPSEDTVDIEGVTYPLINVHISSSSHPFFTGEERIVDIEGRVDKFKARAAAGAAAREQRAKSAQKKAKRQAVKATKQKEKSK